MNVEDLGHIDLILAGSPCTDMSFSGKRKGLSTVEGIEIKSLNEYLELKKQGFEFAGQSYLFWEFIRILNDVRKTNPDVLPNSTRCWETGGLLKLLNIYLKE